MCVLAGLEPFCPLVAGHTVDGSEIPNNHLRCVKPVVDNGIFTM